MSALYEELNEKNGDPLKGQTSNPELQGKNPLLENRIPVYTNAWFEPYEELNEKNGDPLAHDGSDSEVLSYDSNTEERIPSRSLADSSLNTRHDTSHLQDDMHIFVSETSDDAINRGGLVISGGEECRETDRMFTRIAERYNDERQKINSHAHVLEAVDVDGWGLESSQFDLVEDADEDLTELKVLLQCCDREDNRMRLQKAIREFELKLRIKRTWAWFPLTRWEWYGFEYEKPIITIDYKVPGAGKLAPQDIHCDFGDDWFDLMVWNVVYPDDPGVKYHHRVKKTRLMRDIVPSECSVKAVGDHVYVYLQKVKEPRHGYCAWPDLAAGKGRKPFKYNEDAPDGGLMEFFEGEYEKHEGYDGFRRDIGKAMEKIHRREPIRGIDDSPIEEA